MPVNDELGKRMKEFYESVPKTRLVRRTPLQFVSMVRLFIHSRVVSRNRLIVP